MLTVSLVFLRRFSGCSKRAQVVAWCFQADDDLDESDDEPMAMTGQSDEPVPGTSSASAAEDVELTRPILSWPLSVVVHATAPSCLRVTQWRSQEFARGVRIIASFSRFCVPISFPAVSSLGHCLHAFRSGDLPRPK